MKDMYSSIYLGFILSGLIALILGSIVENKISVISYIIGYCALTLGMLMICYELGKNIVLVIDKYTILQKITNIALILGPFILILCSIGLMLYSLITYKKNIIDGHVSQGYYSFNTIIMLLISSAIYLIYDAINSVKYETTKKIPSGTNGILYLITILITICSINIFTILKYFTTDGFSNFMI